MRIRYKELLGVLSRLDIHGLQHVFLASLENISLHATVKQPENLATGTKSTQNQTCTLLILQSLLDGIMEIFPETGLRLSQNARVIYNFAFEGALVRIQNNSAFSLTLLRHILCSKLRNPLPKITWQL